ncbi:MAG TPA: hypothetical protein VHO47_05395 [Candidatus Babeliales bacterium]|nr:hypothetical protein [Candidatus Babeliales bacterium]
MHKMHKRLFEYFLFMGIPCALNGNDAARNPFEFAPPVMPHEQIQKKEVVTTEPVETKNNSESEKLSNSSWEIIKQSEQAALVRKGDGSLCKIEMQR